MIKTLSLLSIVLLVACANTALAQTVNVTITKSSDARHVSAFSDCWFAVPQNYEDQAGKYLMLYVTSDVTTTAHVVQAGGIERSIPIQAFKVTSFNMPLDWEMKTSGQVENKGVHVWADSGKLVAYVMSHSPYTSDGSYILPTISLGTDYVVASYPSLFQLTWDYPSEFTVAAAGGPATVRITPTADVRSTSPTTVLCKANDTVTIALPEYGAVQFKAVQAQNANDYDLSGTLVHADALVQVVGATQCANIPSDYPYCDFIDEAIPPVSSWGKDYYTAPFANRKGGDSFLLISSVSGQKFYWYGASTGEHLIAIIDNQYGKYLYPQLDEPSHWHSDQPFLLVQYINSATWPNSSNNPGDPAMLVINPTQSYSNHVIFQAPATVGNQSAYTNYATVIVRNNAINSTTFDGKGISTFPKLAIDNVYSAYIVSNLGAGAHEVLSDSGVSVSSYGYGYDESYAWAAPGWKEYSQSTVADSTSPNMTYTTSGHCATLTATENVSTLTNATVVNPRNVTILIDSGAIKHLTQSVASICALDTFSAASGGVRYFDAAGNFTLGTMTYTAPQGVIAISTRAFAPLAVGSFEEDSVLTITNVSAIDVRIDSIRCSSSPLTISPSIQGTFPFILAPSASRSIDLRFTPSVADTIPLYFTVYAANAQRIDSTVIGPAYAIAGVSTPQLVSNDLTIHEAAGNEVTATFTNARTGSASVEIYSILGDRILQFQQFVNAGDAAVSVNTERLAEGSYFLRVTMPDRTVATARFAKTQ